MTYYIGSHRKLVSKAQVAAKNGVATWLWLKITQEGLRGFWSVFPLTKVPFWNRFFEPLPFSHPWRVCNPELCINSLGVCLREADARLGFPKLSRFHVPTESGS